MKRIYLDHNATSPILPCVKEKLLDILDIYGNPSSLHKEGRNAKALIENSREKIAQILNCQASEIIFNSGGSESNNSILNTFYQSNTRVITSAIEHPSILLKAKGLESQGQKFIYLNPNSQGVLSTNDLKLALKENPTLVSIMQANNETGVIQPIDEMAELCKEKQIPFHSDLVQFLGKSELPNLKNSLLTYASFSAHKIGAIKGIGACFIRKGSFFSPSILGGLQEKEKRAGTENILGIVAFATALEFCAENKPWEKSAKLRQYLEEQISKHLIPQNSSISIIGEDVERLPNTLCLSIQRKSAALLVSALDLKGIAVSAGSACASGSIKESYVLCAMGLKHLAKSTLRISLGFNNTYEDMDYLILKLKELL